MDYFEELIKYIEEQKAIVYEKSFKKINEEVKSVLGHELSDEVSIIYSSYAEFKISWLEENRNKSGYVDFVPYVNLEEEHKNLVESVAEIYDMSEDEFEIADDINNWFPLFKFRNGDMFCLDKRDGKIKFFEHDVIDCGPNLHGIIISKSVNELFSLWSKIHFLDAYYWDECVDENGLNLKTDICNSLL